jgi:cyclophilin family peptidyl-prolyl cis-trans isomerase
MDGVEGRIANFALEYGNGLANVENGQFVYSEEARETYKTLGGTPFLDMQYTVFGYVIEGLDIVDSIAAVPTDRRRGDRPLEDVVMSMKRLN